MLQRTHSAVTLHVALHPSRSYGSAGVLHGRLGMAVLGVAGPRDVMIPDCSSATE